MMKDRNLTPLVSGMPVRLFLMRNGEAFPDPKYQVGIYLHKTNKFTSSYSMAVVSVGTGDCAVKYFENIEVMSKEDFLLWKLENA